MAHFLRLKLQAGYQPRLFSSPALASNVLDPRHISWKCYAGSALLEESCNTILNANDIDGHIKAANGAGVSARKGNGVEDKASKDSDLDKLTNSICDKLCAKANVIRDKKDKGFQEDSLLTKESKKADNNDLWQQVVSTVRSMVIKNKAKAGAGVNSGVPNMKESDDPQDFSDLDLSEGGTISRGSNGSNKDSPAMSTFGNRFKQKTSQSQFSRLQMSKDTKPVSLSEPLDDSTPLSSLLSPDESTSTAQTEIPKSCVDLNMPKGKGPALPQEAEDGTSAGISDLKADPSYASEATPQSSQQDNSFPQTCYTVCVQNVTSTCNPGLIKSMMSTYGEVLRFYKRAVRNDVYNVYAEFKTADSMEAAIAAPKLQIGTKVFLVTRTDQVFSTVVRLSKVSTDTTEKQLFHVCGKFGRIDNIRKRINGVYDVYYQMKELPNMGRILEKLNEVTLNRATWTAVSAPTLHPSAQRDALTSPEGQAWHDIQVNLALNRIESGIDGIAVLFEDLKEITALGKAFSKR